MWSDQKFYYSDSSFQLELNLQSVRRSLIQILDDFEAADCRRCSLLKCRCEHTEHTKHTGPTSPHSATDSGQNSADEHKAPPAIDLPRPDFKTSSESNGPPVKDVESWVRASTPNPDKTQLPGSKPVQVKQLANFWPPAPKSVWNDYKKKISRPEINTATVSQANVRDFFKSFSLNMYCAGSKHAYAQNRALAQKIKIMAGKQLEYTHF